MLLKADWKDNRNVAIGYAAGVFQNSQNVAIGRAATHRVMRCDCCDSIFIVEHPDNGCAMADVFNVMET